MSSDNFFTTFVDKWNNENVYKLNEVRKDNNDYVFNFDIVQLKLKCPKQQNQPFLLHTVNGNIGW